MPPWRGEMCRTAIVDLGLAPTRMQILHRPCDLGQITDKNLSSLRNALCLAEHVPGTQEVLCHGGMLWAVAPYWPG